jgi:hypothetical protein
MASLGTRLGAVTSLFEGAVIGCHRFMEPFERRGKRGDACPGDLEARAFFVLAPGAAAAPVQLAGRGC